jgi:16S rRNA processing protein RimM
VLEAVRPAVPRLLVRFAGVATREQAAELTNGEIAVSRERLPDPGPGVAYAFQLVGLEVRAVDGRVLGAIADVLMAGAHPIYVVRGEGGKEILVPVIEPVVKKVDLAAGVVTVDPPAGLEDL